METLTNIEERIKKVITDRLKLCVDVQKISRSTPLIGKGLVLDSIALQELVIGLEGEFNIFIDESKLRIEYFENIGNLAKYVSKELSYE